MSGNDDRKPDGPANPALALSPYGARRMTSQRRVIVRAIDELSRAFTVDELAVRARGIDSTIGTATVYRAVANLDESDWIERVGERNGSVLYARCHAEEHHHHLVCTGCGRIEPAACPLDAGLTEAAARAGFLLTDHEVTLYGLCQTCRPAESRG